MNNHDSENSLKKRNAELVCDCIYEIRRAPITPKKVIKIDLYPRLKIDFETFYADKARRKRFPVWPVGQCFRFWSHH
jgi:hypothetical protein